MSNTNTKIFSEAIAEAKSIRETAMANAKLALEEAFAPRMQEMMSSRLEALAEENEEMEEDSHTKNGAAPEDQMDSMEEISLEELLAELEALEEDSYSEKEGSVDPGIDDPYMEENQIFEEAEDDDTVGEITVDDLRDIIRDVVADLMGSPEEEEMAGEEEEMAGEEEEAGEDEKEDEFNLEEILAELELEETADKDADDLKETADKDEDDKELEEAMNTIATLRSELNEVNLLNAKLLYVNKLFKSKNLTEAQKVKVINAFDRAETVKETKNIFETLQESLNAAPTKNSIKESLSYASKPVGVADRKPIVENNDFVLRMQKLAGII
jgi:hypothetical protein